MNQKKYILIGALVLIILCSVFILNYPKSQPSTKQDFKIVHLTDDMDPDIVLINVEEGNRSFIGNLLLKIDSCNPALIGIDAWFIDEKDTVQDATLMKALRAVENDILGYDIDSNGMANKSHSKFTSLVKDQGSVMVEAPEGVSSFFTPLQSIESQNYPHFSLQVIKHWKPEFAFPFKSNEVIPIKYTRTLKQFVHFNGSQLTVEDCNRLKNKVVLLGFLGPGDEDKHFTPIRNFGRFDADEPDTYGLVVIANQIRTILELKE